jgi:predicted RNA-binding protein YlxR (DUF448 family)
VACRTPRAKRDLVRVVRSARTRDLAVDPKGKASGRGAYFCRDGACVERGLKEGSLARALEMEVDAATAERLRADISRLMS